MFKVIKSIAQLPSEGKEFSLIIRSDSKTFPVLLLPDATVFT
jgi:hypothetical protein